MIGWAFLEWRFDGSALAFVTSDLELFGFEVSPLADQCPLETDPARDVDRPSAALAQLLMNVAIPPETPGSTAG